MYQSGDPRHRGHGVAALHARAIVGRERPLFLGLYDRDRNRGAVTVQLKTRHWRITDGFGRVQEVRGAGVVGEEPVLEPGASYEYTSGVPLPTPSGFMVGTYGMVTPDGEQFDIDIPAFSLDGPETKRTLN